MGLFSKIKLDIYMKFKLFRFPEDLREKIEKVLQTDTQEAIVLKFILNHGSVTVRDLLPKMNYPCGPIRDLQETAGITLLEEWETSEKKVLTPDGKERVKKTRFKRYRLAGV